MKPKFREDARKIEREKIAFALRATYYCEYNRKLLVKER